jgi:WD40 repeat protein
MKVNKLWSYNYNDPILGFQIADINNNGQVEIITHNKTGNVFFISLDGHLLYKELISKDKPIWHLKVFDIDDDGEKQLIFGGMDGILRTFNCNLTYNLQTIWIHRFNSSISGILIEDINNDNIYELIAFSLDNTIRVLNPYNGDLIWGQVFQNGIGDAIIFINDKKLIIGAGNDGTIRIFNGLNGNLQWFKKFSDKIRCVCFLNSVKGGVILCGGDDKKLHFINEETQNEFKTNEFGNYVWKCKSYPSQNPTKAIISTYSFDYFDDSISIENIKFSSKITCINEYLECKWEIIGFNTECLYIIELPNDILICVGTTKGELIIIEEKTGRILFNEIYSSCLNSIQFNTEKKLLICCHDDGTIVAYSVEDILV